MAIAGLGIAIVAFLAPGYVPALGVTVGFILSPPTVFGVQTYALGTLLVVVSCAAAVLQSGGIRLSWQAWGPMTLLGVAAAWVAISSAMVITFTTVSPLYRFMFFFAPAIALVVAMGDRVFADRLRRCICGVILAVSLVVTVTFLLGLIVGFERLRVGTFPFGYADRRPNELLMPGAVLYGDGGDGEIPRFLGLGRESGVGALFIGWAIFAMPSTWRPRVLLYAILLVALAATMSTAGIGIFTACLLLRVAFGRRGLGIGTRVATAVLALVGLWIAATDSTFGLFAKESGGTSAYTDRVAATMDGLNAAISHPLFPDATGPNSAINLIASIASFGLPWVIAMIALMALPVLFGGRDAWQTYAAVLLLITVLTSQPLAGAPALLFLALINVATLSPSKELELSAKSAPNPGEVVGAVGWGESDSRLASRRFT